MSSDLRGSRHLELHTQKPLTGSARPTRFERAGIRGTQAIGPAIDSGGRARLIACNVAASAEGRSRTQAGVGQGAREAPRKAPSTQARAERLRPPVSASLCWKKLKRLSKPWFGAARRGLRADRGEKLALRCDWGLRFCAAAEAKRPSRYNRRADSFPVTGHLKRRFLRGSVTTSRTCQPPLELPSSSRWMYR